MRNPDKPLHQQTQRPKPPMSSPNCEPLDVLPEMKDTIPNRMMLMNCAIQMFLDVVNGTTDQDQLETMNGQLNDLTSGLRQLCDRDIPE